MPPVSGSLKSPSTAYAISPAWYFPNTNPAKLYDEISRAEFQQRMNSGSASAYIGHFQNGKLVRMEKHLRGKTEYVFDYH
ncbi:MAG: hypothetical protein ACFNLD_05950 [Kingella oralis]|uniref:hypothetical protein n=1 Tax=Kingella oralis TaxID=505 RepID=UPI002D80284B|nr:hypothetical protein [Kingella oralis]